MTTHPTPPPAPDPTARHRTLLVYAQRLAAAIRHIREHFAEPLSPADLARTAHFSPFHFQRIFRAMTGESLGEFIRRTRLDHAARLLTTTDDPIAAVAAACGYSSQEALTRALKARFGVTPSALRDGRTPDFWTSTPSRAAFDAGRILPADSVQEPRAMITVEIRNLPLIHLACTLPAPTHPSAHQPPPDAPADAAAAAEAYGHALGRLMVWASERGLPIDNIHVLDHAAPDRWASGQLSLEPGLPIPQDTILGPGVTPRRIGGGPHAVATFTGAPDAVSAALDWLYTHWLPANGLEPADSPAFHTYTIPAPTPEDIEAETCAINTPPDPTPDRDPTPDIPIPTSLTFELAIPIRPLATTHADHPPAPTPPDPST